MNEKKLASRAAVICYGFGDLASQFVWTFVGTYLTVFYSSVVGLAPAVVSAIMLIARLWDAVNDPLMGAMAERTRSRFGRFRPYVAFGCPILAIMGVVTFTHPFSGSSTAGIIWAAATYIIAGMVYTLVNIPYGAMAAVMTEDDNQRNSINTSRNIGMNLGMVIVNAVSAPLMLAFSGKGAEVASSTGYTMTAVIYGIISIPMFLLVFFTAREHVKPAPGAGSFSFKATISNLVRNKHLMIIMLVMVLQMTAFMGRIAVTSFYVIYCLHSFAMISVIMTIPSIAGIIGSFAVPFLCRKFGKRNSLMWTMLIQAAGLVVIYLAPYDNMPMIIVGCVIFGLANVGFPISLSMVADSVDLMEHKTGVRTDGTAYATYGLATKIGNAVGGSVGLLIMTGIFHFNPQLGPFDPQAAGALNGVNIVVNLIPAIIFVLSALACLLWRTTDKDMVQIRDELKQRREGK